MESASALMAGGPCQWCPAHRSGVAALQRLNGPAAPAGRRRRRPGGGRLAFVMAGLVVAGLVQAPTQNRRIAAGGCHRLDRRQASTTPLRPPAEAPRLSTLILSLFAAAHMQVKAGAEDRGRRQRAQPGRGRSASSPACSRPPSGVLGTMLVSPCHLGRHNHCWRLLRRCSAATADHRPCFIGLMSHCADLVKPGLPKSRPG